MIQFDFTHRNPSGSGVPKMRDILNAMERELVVWQDELDRYMKLMESSPERFDAQFNSIDDLNEHMCELVQGVDLMERCSYDYHSFNIEYYKVAENTWQVDLSPKTPENRQYDDIPF